MERGKIKDPKEYCALDESGYCINCSYMENGRNVFDANIINDGNVMKAKKDEIGKAEAPYFSRIRKRQVESAAVQTRNKNGSQKNRSEAAKCCSYPYQ